MKSLRIAELLQSPATDAEVVVKGWVRTKRGNKNVAFIALNDGSCVANMQVVVDLAKFDEELLRKVTTGACLRVDGRLVASCGAGQGVEVQAEKIEIYGTADPETYPLQKKGHSLEFLRDIAYLRPRTNTFGAIFRIRHAMAYAIHKYFNDKGFYYLHTPLITASDCEGAGAMFQVTTLDMNNLPRTGEGRSTTHRTSSARRATSRCRASSKASWAHSRWAASTPSAPRSVPKTPIRRATSPSSG